MNDRDTRRYYDRPDRRPDLRAGLEALKDTVLHRSEALADEQRALLTIILEQGSSFQQIARLRGEHATTVSRRFRRLLGKLSGRTAARGPVKDGHLNPIETTILADYCLCGMNQMQIAAKLGISRHRVRKTLDQFATQQNSVLATAKQSLTVPPVAQRRRQSCTR
jgi:DNA-directed RNA polymerase specialized sigma24 family protein